MPVRDHKGLRLLPDASLANAKPIDLLIVPGGPGQEDLMEDKQVLSFLTAQAGRAKCVFSVYTGALLCGAAGLLSFRDGKVAHEHIYWDQASVLVQLGLVDATGLPIVGAASAEKVLNPNLPFNALMQHVH